MFQTLVLTSQTSGLLAPWGPGPWVPEVADLWDPGSRAFLGWGPGSPGPLPFWVPPLYDVVAAMLACVFSLPIL